MYLLLLIACLGVALGDEVPSNVTVPGKVSVCDLPLATGNCKLNITRFYYDRDTNQCYKFIYHGCNGNANRFINDKQCRQRCRTKPKLPWVTSLNDFMKTGIAPFNLTCENCATIGGVCVDGKCQCRMGYQLTNYTCVDVDECKWTKCGPNAVCVNSRGSFRCECALGFAGSGLNCTDETSVCGQPFDRRYEESCDNIDPPWQQRYFFNVSTGACEQFRYGGCQFSGVQNIFRDLQSCQTHCGGYAIAPQKSTTPFAPVYRQTTTKQLPDLCFDTFDESKRFPCTHAYWKSRYYFDLRSRHCVMFWYDESCDYQQKEASTSRNIFVHRRTCEHVCELVAREQPEIPNPGVAGVIIASYDRNWTLEKAVEEKRLHDASTTTTIAMPTFATLPPIDLDNVIRPEPVPATPTPGHLVTLPDESSVFIDHQHISDFQRDSLISTRGRNDAAVNYSLAAHMPITIAEECLDPFDHNLAKSCQQTVSWTDRYYFDPDSRTCRMYWNGGCWSHSRNNFENLEQCKWQCEGTHAVPETRHCLDPFDKTYLGDCRNGAFEIRYYFNHAAKRCDSFYFGGCRSESRNLFMDLGECQSVCETAPKDITAYCRQPFDPQYKKLCNKGGHYTQYYYFDQATDSCKMFWYGNCKSTSQNIFATIETCQWLCERKRDHKVPRHCQDKFDSKYREACNGGKWVERYFFDHLNGQCRPFWYDGCISDSENIFTSKESCVSLCEAPTASATTALTTTTTTTTEMPQISQVELEKESIRCLEPLAVGNCKEALPAYYYNSAKQVCEPFSYTGCRGNGNRFLTLSQCDNTCAKYRHLDANEANCFLPLSIGYGRKRKSCIRTAGYYFHYNAKEGRCGRFWYLGCGGNANRYRNLAECERICRRSADRPLRTGKSVPVAACFKGIDKGKCQNKQPGCKSTRWAYSAGSKKCSKFEYAGCGGNENNFASEHECEKLCGGLTTPNSMQCAHFPDWGPCNRLRYMWFFNMTKGTCEQFLYGGCGGNDNRFSTFEHCQVTCEVPGEDPCNDRLDRGNWCESMSNRYYYHKKSRTCKGFHYTGCGKSRNNFVQLDDCENICVHRSKTMSETAMKVEGKKGGGGAKYAGRKPPEHQPMTEHKILKESDQHYFKTPGQWVEYGHCLGFRYNISGPETKLNSYICLMEQGGTCHIQTLTDTGGEERCRVVRPWLRGSHYYSWFFTVERRKRFRRREPQEVESRGNDTLIVRPQRANDTVATLMMLPLNDCFNIC
uniref:Kunitz/Bovine pancreatic trypsin inhibitor domain protein n=1 Tax=Panagrellus redivivus TaxID=6233 RepID=A0A7E4W475_PANRE